MFLWVESYSFYREFFMSLNLKKLLVVAVLVFPAVAMGMEKEGGKPVDIHQSTISTNGVNGTEGGIPMGGGSEIKQPETNSKVGDGKDQKVQEVNAKPISSQTPASNLGGMLKAFTGAFSSQDNAKLCFFKKLGKATQASYKKNKTGTVLTVAAITGVIVGGIYSTYKLINCVCGKNCKKSLKEQSKKVS
jgi:hypothetical protein